MKDSSPKFNLTLAAFLLPIFALGIILSGSFIINQSVLAQESDTTISVADESYFTDSIEKSNTLAQSGGLLQPRESSIDEETATVASDTEAQNCSTVYLENDLRIDFDNNIESVLKLQSFLKTYEEYDYIELNGSFDEFTLRAVQSFQTRYAEDVLEPWGYEEDEATGYVYITTKKKINEIYCDQRFSLSEPQQQEIREFRELLNELRNQGYSFETPNYLSEYFADMNKPVPEFVEDPEPITDNNPDSDSFNDDSDDKGTTTNDQDDRNFFQRLFGLGGSDPVVDEDTPSTTVTTTDVESTATSSTSTTNDENNRNFIQRLFGTGTDNSDEENATTTATSTNEESAMEGNEAPVNIADNEMNDTSKATGTAVISATTSSLDDMASGVYNGINSIFNFLLSPTFLLIVLVILILLLIATVIESDDDTDKDNDDVDPWAEYDETQSEEEIEGDDEKNTVSENKNNLLDDTAPNPPTNKDESKKSSSNSDNSNYKESESGKN